MANRSLDSLGHVHLTKDMAQLHDDLASALYGSAIRAVEEQRVFHLALSGGSTPEPFYMNLIIDPRWRGIPWSKTHLWLVDERCVPLESAQSNWKMIRETLAEHVPIKHRQLHPMPVGQDQAAALYEHELRAVILGNDSTPAIPVLDFVLLGMGTDGHTASLFPHSPALMENKRLVTNNQGPMVTPPPRLTMTYPLLRSARQLAILVTGSHKTPILQTLARQLQEHGPNPELYPVTGLPLEEPSVTWFLDAAAAGGE